MRVQRSKNYSYSILMKIKIRKADTLFSEYIRTRDRWTCQRCGVKHEEGSRGLHCSHFFGRRKESIRFDPKNCHAICFGCHSFLDSQPEEHRRWIIEKIGKDEFLKLQLRAETPGKKNDKLVIEQIKILTNNLRKENQ